MKRLIGTLAILAAAALPAHAWQEQDLKKENERLRAEIEVLRRQAEIEEVKRAAKDAPSVVIGPAAPVLEGKVTAAANDVGLVILSLGRDDGVREGDEFTVHRDSAFVAKVVVDKVDKKWCSCRVLLKKSDPRVSDDVSNRILKTAPAAVVKPAPMAKGEEESLKAIRAELEEVRRQIRELTDLLTSSWNDQGVSVEVLSEEWRGHFSIAQGLLVRKVRAGSAAEKAGLRPFDVLPGLTEAQLLEALAKGTPVKTIRPEEKSRHR